MHFIPYKNSLVLCVSKESVFPFWLLGRPTKPQTVLRGKQKGNGAEIAKRHKTVQSNLIYASQSSAKKINRTGMKVFWLKILIYLLKDKTLTLFNLNDAFLSPDVSICGFQVKLSPSSIKHLPLTRKQAESSILVRYSRVHPEIAGIWKIHLG